MLYFNKNRQKHIEFASPALRETQTSGPLFQETATRAIDAAWLSIYQVLPNPDPVLRKTGRSIDVLEEIGRELQVSACMSNREAGTIKRKWKIEPGKASPAAVDVANWVFSNINMRTFKSETLQAVGYGYQVPEVVWERLVDLLLPVKIIGKPQRWFLFGKENELRMRTAPGDMKGSPVDPYKFLLTQYRPSFDNPYGEAQLSNCFWPVTFKKGGLKFWAKFLERFGMPHAAGKLPRNANATDRSELLTALSNLIQDACAIIPDDSSVQFLEMKNITGSSDAYLKYVNYHDGEISTALLGHSAAVSSTPGKLGNENMASAVRSDIIDGDCAMIEETAAELIKWVHENNPSLGTERPRFVLYSETDIDINRADRDSKLAATGRVKFTKKYFLKNYDFDEGDIVIIDPPAA